MLFIVEHCSQSYVTQGHKLISFPKKGSILGQTLRSMSLLRLFALIKAIECQGLKDPQGRERIKIPKEVYR